MRRARGHPLHPAPAAAEPPETLILSVRLTSGKFESELRLPLMGVSDADKNKAVEQWLDLIQTGFRIGATNMTADLKP